MNYTSMSKQAKRETTAQKHSKKLESKKESEIPDYYTSEEQPNLDERSDTHTPVFSSYQNLSTEQSTFYTSHSSYFEFDFPTIYLAKLMLDELSANVSKMSRSNQKVVSDLYQNHCKNFSYF
jgi:hypothetical protein